MFGPSRTQCSWPSGSVGPSCMLVILNFSALRAQGLPRAHVRPCPKHPSLLGSNHISTTSRVPAARRAGTHTTHMGGQARGQLERG